jgi:putative ABC transport system permease protein
VRAALGASRFRIARQVLIENLVLAAFGGVVGTGVAALGLRLLLALAPDDLPRIHQVHLDSSVLGFTFGLTILAGILFGVMPAMRAAATGVHDRLRSAGRGVRGSRDGGRARRLLVVTEVALAVVLVTGAGLLLRSFALLRGVDPGFRAEDVTTFAVSLPSTRYATAEQWDAFSSALLARLRRLPGVSSAATSFELPLSGGGFGFTFTISGRDASSGTDEPRAQVRVASSEYFQAMGIPLVRGRLFDARDRGDGPPVLVISSELARRYFPGEEPIGRVLQTGWNDGVPGRRFGGEIIGIVGDVRQSSLESGVTQHMYMSATQWPLNDYDVVVRASTSFAAVVSGARSALQELDPDIPLGGARPLDELVDGALGNRRFYMMLLGAFASVALALALVGIYGVMAYGVRLRRQEIGVRLALGATGVRIVRMVLGDGLRLVMSGVIIGALAAFALTRLLESLLYDVRATDPAAFVVASLSLVVAATVACIVPARGAARLDPVDTIRAD